MPTSVVVVEVLQSVHRYRVASATAAATLELPWSEAKIGDGETHRTTTAARVGALERTRPGAPGRVHAVSTARAVRGPFWKKRFRRYRVAAAVAVTG